MTHEKRYQTIWKLAWLVIRLWKKNRLSSTADIVYMCRTLIISIDQDPVQTSTIGLILSGITFRHLAWEFYVGEINFWEELIHRLTTSSFVQNDSHIINHLTEIAYTVGYLNIRCLQKLILVESWCLFSGKNIFFKKKKVDFLVERLNFFCCKFTFLREGNLKII